MNKKVLTLVITIIIIAVIGSVIFFTTKNTSNANTINIVEENTREETNTGSKTLILYFSMSGNTQTVANYIHDNIGGDIIKLETVETYPKDYNELVDYAQEEQQENARPELKTTIDNIDQYDSIFLGYPNWWGDMPMPIYTFLDEYDLSGKTIVPFVTHGGSGLSRTDANIQEEEPDATVTEGLAIYGNDAENSQSEVEGWLDELGL